ncbi:MAG: hypothetical protein AB7S26_23460 [Sandaracinaceae bacterium]
MRPVRVGSSILASAALLASVAVGQRGGDPSPSLHYTVWLNDTVEHMTVQACFDDGLPSRLGPGVDAASVALEGAWVNRRRARVVGGRIVLDGYDARCMRYRVDLEAARRSSRFGGRFGTDLVSSQGTWLWRDRSAPPRGGATLRFVMPDGVHDAAPWPVVNDRYVLEESAFRRPGFIAIGRFTPIAVEAHGVRARVVRLGEGWALDDAETERWLNDAIEGVSLVQGRFPVDEMVVLLVPRPGRGLGFGMVRRGGGFSVAFQVGTDSSVEDIERDWVAWHELSHLHLPALPSRDAWMYEGLATYYQEIVPTRLGIQTPERAWDALSDGFSRGARQARTRSASGPPRPTVTLADASRTMMQTYGFTRVYWAGTAFMLEADVALRERDSSLDAAIAGAAPAWRHDLSEWTSERVTAAMDRTLSDRVLRPLRDRYASSVGFPRTPQLLRRLGVSRPGGRITLSPAERSAVRDAIMQRRTSP